MTTHRHLRPLLPTATRAESWSALLRLLGPRARTAVVAGVTLVLASSAGVVAPILLGTVVDQVADGSDTGSLVAPIAGLAALALVAGLLDFAAPALVARIGEPAVAQLRESVVSRALAIDLADLERSGTGDLLSRVTEDVQLVKEAAQGVFTYFATAALTIAATLVGLAVLDWRFLVAGLLAVPIQVFALRRYLGQASAVYAGERIARGSLSQQELDSLGGARTVRAFRVQGYHLDLVGERSTHAIGFALRAVRMRTTFFARLNAAEFVGLSAVLVAGYLAVRADAVSLGSATAAALLFVRLFDPINIVLGLVDEVQEAAAGLARLVGVTKVPAPEIPKHPATPIGSALDVRGLTFAYVPEHRVLTDVTLTVAEGERVAVVGASGAGKSTLAKIVAGMHEPTGGTVTLGGVQLGAMSHRNRQRTIALVTQEVHVFEGTLADNLRLGKPEATTDDLWHALETVAADAWTRQLPDGVDTVVGAGSHRLTATEAQQLALARLVLADPQVVVLDEATAEAGSAGARVLESAAESVLNGRTALIVAHRLSQAVSADRIIVMRGGEVVEVGSHQELAQAGGDYERLWDAWRAHRSG